MTSFLIIFFALVPLFHAAELSSPDVRALCAMVASMQGLPDDWNCADESAVVQTACNSPWTGLTCWNPTNTTDKIFEIDLSGVSGTIPREMGGLSRLRNLKLRGTNLGGHLPSTFDSLRELITMDIQGTGISGGCFPQSLINNDVFSNCRADDASFSCKCDAPASCRAKPCCASVAGIEDAGMICVNGKWEVPPGVDLTIDELTIQQESLTIETSVTVTSLLEIRLGSLDLNGDLIIESDRVVIAGITSNITLSGCLNISNPESTLILQIIAGDKLEKTQDWNYIKSTSDCIYGDWKEIVLESINYEQCLASNAENTTDPTTIQVWLTESCDEPFPKEAVLGIVLGFFAAVVLIAAAMYIYNNEEAYEYVFPGRAYHKINDPDF